MATVATALLVPGGPAVYLGSGLLLTAAHLVNPGVDLSVVIAGAKLPVKVLKQGIYEDIDLSLLHFDQSKLPPTLPTVQLCSTPPWPGDPVIVIDSGDHEPKIHRERQGYREIFRLGRSDSGLLEGG